MRTDILFLCSLLFLLSHPCPVTAAIGFSRRVSFPSGLGHTGGWRGWPGAASPISQGRLIRFGWAEGWGHSFLGVSWHFPPFPAAAESPQPPHISILSLHPFLLPLISFTPSLQPFWSLPSESLRTEQKSLPAHLRACCILIGQKIRMF